MGITISYPVWSELTLTARHKQHSAHRCLRAHHSRCRTRTAVWASLHTHPAFNYSHNLLSPFLTDALDSLDLFLKHTHIKRLVINVNHFHTGFGLDFTLSLSKSLLPSLLEYILYQPLQCVSAIFLMERYVLRSRSGASGVVISSVFMYYPFSF